MGKYYYFNTECKDDHCFTMFVCKGTTKITDTSYTISSMNN